ncbi:MAG: GAF domain-containing sensor histidine kinase [bacterium]|nr:GAF domain-containing sensor histidine kinase [bacterium]
MKLKELHIDDVWDPMCVAKASQVISSEVGLDKLPVTIMTVILECTGAGKGFLVLDREGRLGIEAAFNTGHGEGFTGVEVMQSAAIEGSGDLSEEIIRYVVRTGESVMLPDPLKSKAGQFGADPYIMKNRPESLLCLPVRHKEVISGVIYLENGLTSGAFTPDRLEVLRILLAQAGISIENALLYDKLHQQQMKIENALKVRQAELEVLNVRLEQRVREEVDRSRQKDHVMILQSRQAAMGEMIGHIAHQWRQPLNVLNLLLENIKDAHDHGELDRDYLEQAISKGKKFIRKMSVTIDDFRNYFRPDKKKENFNINHIIEDTLSLVEPSFKYHHITVKVEQEEQLQAPGFPNECSQVILNILNNSKDAIVQHKVKQGEIVVDSFSEGNYNIIRIRDNGGGIPDPVMGKIFDPYFSTKKDGTGTGIGLYMSRVMVEEHMNGKIRVKNIEQGVEFRILLPKV